MSSAAQILQMLMFSVFSSIIGAAKPPSFRPTDYFDADTINRLKILDKPMDEWNTEYNYGRNYKHSEGREWGTGYNKQYGNEDMLKNLYEEAKKQSGKLPKAESIQRVLANVRDPRTEEKHQGSMLRSNILKKQFQKRTDSKVKNWYNWPSKNLTWPNWTPKKNPYERQLIPWWNSDDEQVHKAKKVERFMVDRVIPKPKQFFWPGSIGWTGDLGPFSEIPTPPWLTNECCFMYV
ncbi:hypothetical protein ACH3XW_33570 [Acanthocheilonema viteae]|uniref:Uncharacterized protein n=1 Tax=Acanthocheilonema viteae TaxID=6277 RepID=A0A498SCM4_ACAVI|nr:unnamed protein product [Acanthocheilonema viteae]